MKFFFQFYLASFVSQKKHIFVLRASISPTAFQQYMTITRKRKKGKIQSASELYVISNVGWRWSLATKYHTIFISYIGHQIDSVGIMMCCLLFDAMSKRLDNSEVAREAAGMKLGAAVDNVFTLFVLALCCLDCMIYMIHQRF